MKPNRLLLAIASAMMASSVMAGEAVFYVTEDGEAVRDLAVSVDGKKKLVGKSGFVSFDVNGGSHTVELSQYGEFLGEFDFETANSAQNAEVQVEMVGGEAMPEVNVYTPGQEQVAAFGQISGYLISEDTDGAISGARISIAGTEQAVTTDEDGFFSFELPRGEYDLTISDPNYGKREVSGVRVMGNVNTGVNLNMSLEGEGVIEEVVAVGSYIPSTAVAQERDSAAVLDSIGSEQMARFGDSDAASAVKRVAGVAIQDQFAVVRGMPGRYISTTLNGGVMPSTDPMRRDVPLDLFPASVLGGIDIQKSFTPDMPGDSTAGAIAMITKGMPEESAGKVSVKLGYNTRTTFNDAATYNSGDSDWLGYDDGTRDEPSVISNYSDFGNTQYALLPQDQRVAASKQFDETLAIKEKEVGPDRAFSISYGDYYDADFGPHGWYGAFQYSDKWEVRHDAKLDDVDGQGDYQRSKRKIDLSGYFVYAIEAGDSLYTSKTALLRKTDDTTRITTRVDSDIDTQDYSLQWVERQFLSQQFAGQHIFSLLSEEDSLDWNIGIAQTTRDEPDRRAYTYARAVEGDRPYFLSGSIERRYSELTEDALTLGLDYSGDIEFSDFVLKLKAGLSYSEKERDVEIARYGNSTINTINVDTSLPIEQIFSDANIESGSVLYRPNTGATDNYDATDDVFATYLSSEFDWDSVSVLVGARMENSEQSLNVPDARNNQKTKLDELYLLPAISANWRVNEEVQLRFSATQTISRPGLTELSQSEFYDPETDDLVLGNPDLEVSEIKNYDVRAEYYFSEEESVTLALFYKDIADPIERVLAESRGLTTFANAESAEVQGVELDFRINALETDYLSGFVAGNVSYIDSEVDLGSGRAAVLEGSDSRKLQGQSEYLANLQIGLDHFETGQSVTLLANYFDDRIATVSGRGDLENEVEDGRTTWDLIYKYELNEEFVVKGSAKNITDEKVTYSRDGNTTESYRIGSSVSFGVDYSF